MLTKLLEARIPCHGPHHGAFVPGSAGGGPGLQFLRQADGLRQLVLNMLAALVVMAYVVAITAVFIVAFILMLQRFYKNLLGDEATSCSLCPPRFTSMCGAS